jgi:hypothetical protein
MAHRTGGYLRTSECTPVHAYVDTDSCGSIYSCAYMQVLVYTYIFFSWLSVTVTKYMRKST